MELAQYRSRIAERPGSRQQLVSHYRQGEDVARDVDAVAAKLLGAGIARRQHAFPRQRNVRGAGQQLGGAEIQQLHGAFGIDQDVPGLQIAMDDQAPVGIVDRVRHLKNQQQPALHAQPSLIAVLVDGLSLHQFRDEVGIAGGGDAPVQKAGDVVVIQRSEKLPLGQEAAQELGARQVRCHDLQGDRLVELAIGAPRPIDRAHPAPSNQLDCPIGAELRGS